ncbi:carboxymuconolactone decarboxylase family protein [Deinococcus cellulosilyticus]|uniref:Carboxymuconolactone decarboxylase-like domain-containing protein n=1 Tax=Deinococcus cellulosilyticus (strain DSM 18568 / NBRC 106333 / KACC 11606 / 5516J-15) TaxID=1223518 RepID=A0A511N3M9_DEIC1|nr:carboxymuconolactone decarboxylase family protein [Deinococcus cellulosilyticus]GEM47442.1 hypothetical protein DC3_30770 [Deinococcus cellulosilyticus NBRC 106333 = KACC 11606]
MNTRISPHQTHPEAYATMLQMENFIRSTSISARLRELIKIRVSMINGCSYCIDMHTRDAVKYGETPERIYLLSVFEEVPHFSPEEKAALKMAVELTLVHQHGLSEETYQEVARHYTPQQIMELTMITVTINGWNRIAKATNMLPALPQEA